MKLKVTKLIIRYAAARTKETTFDLLSWLGNKLTSAYNWMWYHTEFWIANKLHRRPLTYIMKDWIYPHAIAFLCIVLAWSTALIILSFWHGTTSTVLGILSGLLIAHLCWGSRWLPGEQEYPPYHPDGTK